MLGGLALKKRWQAARKAAGKSIHEPGPNIVFGANAQVALEKFARYFDVEVSMSDHVHMGILTSVQVPPCSGRRINESCHVPRTCDGIYR
jgi:glutamate/tyrosine decarboxylase-like PLP-dependent enzyme